MGDLPRIAAFHDEHEVSAVVKQTMQNLRLFFSCIWPPWTWMCELAIFPCSIHVSNVGLSIHPFFVGYVCWCLSKDEIHNIHAIREIPKRQLQCPGCIYAIVKRRGGRSLDFRFYDANFHNLENLGPPKALSTMLWSSVRTPMATIIQWWSDEIKLCQQERSNVVFWSLWYLLYVAYTTQQQHQPPSSAPPPLAVDEEQVWLTNLYEVNICVLYEYMSCFCTFEPMLNCWLRVVIYASWFKVTFLSGGWRSTKTIQMVTLFIPKRSQSQNCLVHKLNDQKSALKPRFTLNLNVQHISKKPPLRPTGGQLISKEPTKTTSFRFNGGSWTTWKSMASGGGSEMGDGFESTFF